MGFIVAEIYKMNNFDTMYTKALQICELEKGFLSNCKGRFFKHISKLDLLLAKEFDKSFSEKELPSNLPSQKRFIEVIKMRKTRLQT